MSRGECHACLKVVGAVEMVVVTSERSGLFEGGRGMARTADGQSVAIPMQFCR